MGTGDGIAQSSSWTLLPPASMTGSGAAIVRGVSTRSIGKLANKCCVSRQLLNRFIRRFPLAKHSADAGRGQIKDDGVPPTFVKFNDDVAGGRLIACGSMP